MSRCEDFPCCGHAPGDCPDSSGRMRCVECGKQLPRNARSSICGNCLRRAEQRFYETGEMFPERDEY